MPSLQAISQKYGVIFGQALRNPRNTQQTRSARWQTRNSWYSHSAPSMVTLRNALVMGNGKSFLRILCKKSYQFPIDNSVRTDCPSRG
jgi:hypothetical protein